MLSLRANPTPFRAAARPSARRAIAMPVAMTAPTSAGVLSGLGVGCSIAEAPVLVALGSSVMKVTMMRHGNRVKHLGRPADQRKALIRSLVTEVIRHGAIRTTKIKAKVVRMYVDKMVTLAKDGSLHARRQAAGFIYDRELVANLFASAAERYADRAGGYTRIKTEPFLRRGDAAEMAIIELV